LPTGGAHEQAAKQDERLGAEQIFEIAFERDKPGLGDDEDREGDLDRGEIPAEFRLKRIDEEGPAIL
jgi:hypothetical protein